MSYTERDVTEALYSHGTILVTEAVGLSARLDSKATTLSGFIGGILAFLLVGIGISSEGQPLFVAPAEKTLAVLALTFVGSAAVAAFLALWIRTYDWFSDEDWFQKDVLADADQLKRFYVLAMHNICDRRDAVNAQKARLLISAQILFGLAVLASVADLVLIVLRGA